MLSGTLSHDFGRGSAFALDFRVSKPMCPTVTTRPESPGAPDDRAQRLTDGERACLRLVYAHLTSKDIARELGLSNHTVDMRLRTAIRKLGVSSRTEAAKLLHQLEANAGLVDGSYQPLIYQASEIATAADSAMFGAPASAEPGAASSRSSDPNLLEQGSLARTLHTPHRLDGSPPGGILAHPGALTGKTAFGSAFATDRPGIAAPDPGIDARPFLNTRPWGRRNDLAIGHRLGWILFIALASALTFGGVLAALVALKTLI
ncbi:helix-turn-helix domain-containing protein [Sandarakinorhabdus cyanobacteriorum]|uniref:helix-turn-helix domain-containing protein n=1 Tax=Sandarakinorhabdus cyanobacteriorum TaxID=1981098 RepID=UPI001FAF7796|nr:helix-turn-helix transcriptional regulator [Sandarakinorhabdus cyanobacteriorum]